MGYCSIEHFFIYIELRRDELLGSCGKHDLGLRSWVHDTLLYGKVQSVKILPKKDDESGTGVCATVAFIDIKSAAKAHNAENKIEERTLKTDYYEPPASSTASSAIFIHERDDSLVRPTTGVYAATRPSRYQHGLTEERTYDRATGHYYDRVAEREPYLRRPMGMGYHDDDGYQGRGKSRDRYQRAQTGTGTYQDGPERSQNHFRGHNTTRQHFDQQRYPGEQYNDERDTTTGVGRLARRPNSTTTSTGNSTSLSPPRSRSGSRQRQHKRRSPSHSPSGSRSNSRSRSRSRSRSTSGSHSSSSSSKLRSSSSDSSSRSRSPSKSRSPAASYGSQGSNKGGRSLSSVTLANVYLPSAVSTAVSSNSQVSSQAQQGCTPLSVDSEKDEKRPLGICVKNLPVRSTDTSLKDGLFHEYKKHGKVTMVKVIGQGTDRYAVVCFKKTEDVEKALEVSKDKLFFGCRIEVTAHEGIDGEDNEFRPLEAELDEYHPKATRTLFIGNLEKDINTAELRKHFEQFGEIIEIDIKKQGSSTSYAFIQYSDVASVVKAMRKLDGENLGANRIKLGFGKSMPTNCVWLDGITDSISEKFLARNFSRFGIVCYTSIDREKGHSLIFYESVEYAQVAVSEMRGRMLGGKRLQVDFASREFQNAFFERMEMTGQIPPGERPWERRERRGEFEVIRDDREARVGFDGRNYARYDSQQRVTRGTFSRGTIQRGVYSKGKSQGFAGRFDPYHEEFGDRWHRNFDEEYSQTGVSFEDSYEHELREYGYSQRERREYANDDRAARGRSFSPVRRRDTGSASPPLKERHRDDVSDSPHARIERAGRVEKYDDHHSRERYNSRDDDIEEGQSLDGKSERSKFSDSIDRQIRKKNKHRNSVSDQDSHHSQSPPRSRHQSRSTSPPSKEKKLQKERGHHRTKSPSSHSSSRMSSPIKDIVASELIDDRDICCDQKDSSKHKLNDNKTERDLSSLCLKTDDMEKTQLKSDLESLKKRIHSESDTPDNLLSVNEAASRIERRKRLLISAGCLLNRDTGFLGNHVKESLDQTSTKIRNIIHGNTVYSKPTKSDGGIDSVIEGTGNEECKSDAESGELLDEVCPVKINTSECANSDLKYLKKKQVHLLHLLEQLGEGMSSSDTECSTDSEKTEKKVRPSGIDSSSCSGREQIKNSIKQEMFIINDTINSKDSSLQLNKQKDTYKSENSDSSSILRNVDSVLLKKYHDPRKTTEHSVIPSPSHSVERTRRFSTEKEVFCHSDSNQIDMNTDNEIHLSSGLSDTTWKKQTFPTLCIASAEDNEQESGGDNSVTTQHLKVKEDDYSVSDMTSSNEGFSSVKSCRIDGRTSLNQRVSESICTASHELRREREISPLSLPLPKFAASLRSPKMSPNPLSSPKGSAMSPRAGHSPNVVLPGKSNFVHEITKVDKTNLKDLQEERTAGSTSPALLSSQLPKSTSEHTSNSSSVHLSHTLLKPSDMEISSDSEYSPISSPNRPSIEERIRALDEKFNAWSGSSRTFSTSGDTSPTSTLTTVSTVTTTATIPAVTTTTSTADYLKYNIKKRPRFSFLSPEFRTEPSEIVKSLLAKSTIFDQDSKRLERIHEKYEPKEVKLDFTPKTKPLVRTKAAAKEFSIPIHSLTNAVSSLTSLNTTKHSQFTQSAISASNSSSAVTTYNSSSSSLVMSTQCTVPFMPTLENAPIMNKVTENESLSVPKLSLDHLPALSKLLETTKPQPLWKDVASVSTTIQAKPTLSCTHANVFNLHTPVSIKKEATVKDSICVSIKKEPRDDKNSQKKDLFMLSCQKDTQCKSDNMISMPLLKEHNIRKDLIKETGVKKENILKDIAIKQEIPFSIGQDTLTCKRENSVKDVSGTITDSLTVVQPSISKRRVSSIDSNESDSGRSARSTDVLKDCHDSGWQKDDLKTDISLPEPEHKKPKLSHNTKNSEKEKQREKSSSPTPPRKPEKFSSRMERSKSLGSRSSLPAIEREEIESRSVDMKYISEGRERSKSETKQKDERKTKNKESKGNKHEHRTKSKWSDCAKSDKSDKLGQTSSKGRKDLDKLERERNKSERKLSGSDKGKHDLQRSKSKSELKHNSLDEEPVYFSMYDKVKARSSQNQTLKDQAKDLETVRQKFNLLKQSRAKREEKSRSVEMDSDKDSDASRHSSESEAQMRASSKTKQSRKRKLVIESSSDDDDVHSQNTRTEGSRNDCRDTSNEFPSDLEAEYREISSMKKFSVTQNGKRKGKRTGVSDSGSSGSDEQSNNKPSVTSKKKKSNQSQEKVTKRHNQKSDYDTSDTEIIPKPQSKEKEHKRKKIKKEKMFEVAKSDSEGSENEIARKFKEEDKLSKCRNLKGCEDEASLVVDDSASRSENKEHSNISAEKSKLDSKPVESTDKDAKHKSASKKKKKSKKSSKTREKKSAEKPAEMTSYQQNEDEHSKAEDKEELKQVKSPKTESYSRGIASLSPPSLQTAILSDNDFKSDFSDFEFDSHKIQNAKLNSELWKPVEQKMDLDIDICTGNPLSSAKCENENIASKDKTVIVQCETVPPLSSFLENVAECNQSEIAKSLIVQVEQCSENSEKNNVDNSISPVTKEMKSSPLNLDRKESTEAENSKKKEKSNNEGEKGKEERKKKKSKKTQKEKRKKSKSEHSEEDIVPYQQPVAQESTPIFEKLSLIDDDSRLSNIRLDEEIAEEARRLEQELLAAASEETSTFGESEDPCKKEEKAHERRYESLSRKEEKQERRFEEEAAKETRRLEEELLSTARDPWNLKDTKPYDDDSSHDLQILTEPVNKEAEVEVDSESRKEDNIYMGIELGSNSNLGISHPSSQDFLLAPADSDQYKLEDKESVYDMDSQRKIEDDLAVSALLQEMNSEEVSAPELSKETDYLEPLLEPPENGLNYLIPDETTSSLHIAEPSPEISVEESVADAKCENESVCMPQEAVAPEQVSTDESSGNRNAELSAEDTVIKENASEKIQSCEVVKQQEIEEKLPASEPVITEDTFLGNEYAFLEATISPERYEDKKKQNILETDERETDIFNTSDEAPSKASETKLTFEDVTTDTMIVDQNKKEVPQKLEKIDTANEESTAVSEISVQVENEETKSILEDCLNENTNLLDNDEQNVFLSSDPVLDLGDDTRTASPPSYETLEEEINSIREEISETKELFSVHNICANNIELFNTGKSGDIVTKEVEAAEKQEIKENITESEVEKTTETTREIKEAAPTETAEPPSKLAEETKVDEPFDQLSSKDLMEGCEKESTTEPNSSNLFDEPLTIVTDHEEKKHVERPKRGRRPKTRKYSEPSVSLTRPDITATETQVSNKGNKRGRPTSTERLRRSLRSETAEISAVEQHSSDNIHVRDDNLASTVMQENPNTSPAVSNNETNVSVSCADDSGVTTEETSNTEEKEVLPNDIVCCKTNEHVEQLKEEPRKRGRRRKKGSSDHHSSYFSPPSDKNDNKLEDSDQKDHHKPKESRLWLSITSDKTLTEHKLGSKETSNAYDVFEFRDSDEEITFERDLQSSMKERLLESTRTSYGHDHRHHDSKSTEMPHEKEKKHDEPRHKSHHHDDRETAGKEYVTELSQHGKISITIRLHQKEGHDGSSTETAEVVKTTTPEAVCGEDHKVDSSRSDKSSTKDSPTSDSRSIAQGRSIRKSTRLQCQNARTTVDEVIEEVVKGHFKSAAQSDSLGPATPLRVTRRTRSRRSEEIAAQQTDDVNHLDSVASAKAKNEPVFVILDNTVKEYSTEVKKCLISSQDAITSKTTATAENETTKSETKMSLRSFRITRSHTRMEANRDSLLSPKSSQDSNKETVNDSSASISWPAKNETQGTDSGELSVSITRAKESILSAESLQSRAPLPVLKVELPKVTSSSDLKIGENDDSDSRSSPTVLIDPVTGFLTPVSKHTDTSETSDTHLHIKGHRTVHSDKLGPVITTRSLTINSADNSTVSHSGELLGPLPDVVVKKCSVEDSSHLHRTCISPKVISSMHQPTAASASLSTGCSVTHTTSVHHVNEARHGVESNVHQSADEEEVSEKPVSQTVINTPPVHPVSTSSFPETKIPACSSTTTKPLPPVGQPQVSIGQVGSWPVTVPGSPYHVYGSLPTQSAITSQGVKTRSSTAGYAQQTRSTIALTAATNSHIPISDASLAKIITPQKALSINLPSDGETKTEGILTTTSVAVSTPSTTTTTVTSAISQSDVCTVTSGESLSGSERTQLPQSTQSHSKADASGSWTVCKTPPSRSVMSSSETSRHALTTPSVSPPRTTSAIVSSTVIKTEHHSSQPVPSVQIKSPYSASNKQQNTAFLHKPGLPVPAYEGATHSSHGLMASSNSGGVIAELLQNPQLLQQHKDYFATSQQSVSSSAQIGDRLPSHLVRPATSTPTIPTDLAARLGNPTPPHTPTPPVTSATHPLQPSDIHSAHVAGLHLRQPPLIVPSPSSLGIHSELNAAFVHQQMMYAASHTHYAAIHPELRAQQEAQARAAAMGIAPRFPYPHVPPNATAPSGFRQPPEPRQHISVSESKSDTKPLIESSKTAPEHRLHEEREKANQPVKVVRIKQEFDRDMKPLTEIKGHSTLRSEEHETTGLEGKQLSAPSGPLTVGGMRPSCVPYPPSIRHPHLSIPTHERITDSPVVANLYAQGQLRTPLHLVVQSDDHKGTENHQHPQSVKTEVTEKDTKPPMAHQNPPTTVPYHSLDALGHHNRQSSLSMPSVGSPAPGYLEGRPPHLAHSSGALTLKTLVPPLPVSQTHSVPSETRSSHESHKKTRAHSHQGPSQSPGLNTAHSPLPVPPNFPSHSPHPTAVPSHAFPPPTSEPIHRRGGSLHLVPQMGSEAPIHAPPPAHAMSQPAGVPRTQPQTPPHASQVPPQGDSFLLQRYPVMWQGLLALKNDQAAVQMHFVSGNPRIARASLPPMTEGGTPPVRIAQRMRLEQTQLEGVARKMQMVDEHCILLALPCGRDHMDVLQQSNNLRNGFINYLQLKQAAGIVNAAAPGSQQPAYVIHIFPSCEFSNENMARIAPDLLHSVSDIAHLLIIIATV